MALQAPGNLPASWTRAGSRAVASAVLASGGWGPGPGPVDVVASIAGPHNYSRYDVEDQVGAALGKILDQGF